MKFTKWELITYAIHVLVVFHFVILFMNCFSFFILPFCVPWYEATPLCTFLAWLVFTKQPCPLTILENKLRKSIHRPVIGTFVGHYIMKPIYIYMDAPRSEN